MAYVRRRGKSWQAIVRLKGHPPVTATRPTKREAEEWATKEEAAILAGQRGKFPARSLADAFDRYEREVSSGKRGKEYEGKRFAAMRREFPDLCAKVMHTIGSDDLARWRDARLRVVTRGTVQRDINLLRHVWSVAAREWRWCDDDLWKSVRMPGDNPPRTTTWGWREIRRVLRRMGYRTGAAPHGPREEVAYLFLLGLTTCMRLGELQGLTVAAVDLQRHVAKLGTHKTVERVGARQVPLPRRSIKLLRLLVDNAGPDGALFRVGVDSASALFRKYRDQALVSGLTFHDSRATGATLLARRVDPLTLARVLGHKNLAMLSNVYYRESPEAIAARL